MSWLARLLLVCGLLGGSSTGATAQSRGVHPAVEAQRESHFADGSAAVGEGRWEDAVVHFRAARALRETSGTVFNLAVAQMQLGRTGEAIETLQHYLAMPTTQDKAEKRARAKQLIEEMGGTVAAAPTQPTQPRGDEPRAEQPAPVAAEGERPASNAGDDDAWPVTDDDAMAARLDLETNDDQRARKLLPWALVVTGGALLGGALATGIIAVDARDELDSECDGNRCAPRLGGVRDRVETYAMLTDLLWVTGSLALGGGITWLLLDDGERADAASARLRVAPGVVSLEASF